MARYKERWANPLTPVVVGYYDNDTGKSIPVAPGNKDYKEYLEWAALGNIADPAFTPAEIAAYEAAHNKQSDLQDAQTTYAINTMSVAERETLVNDLLGSANTPTEFQDAVIDLFNRIIVYI